MHADRSIVSTQASFIVLAVFLSFSAFAFGCMESWSIATCEVILFIGAALAGFSNPGFWKFPRRLVIPAVFVVAMIVVGVLQLVPLPASLWQHFHAERTAVYTQGAKAEALLHTKKYRVDPFGSDADKPVAPEKWTPVTPKMPGWIPASFTPVATLRALLALAAAFCLMLLLEQLARAGSSMLRRLAWVGGSLGLAITLIALIQYHAKPDRILWLRKSQYAKQAFASFVNPNHGEAFVNLSLPLLYYLLWRASLHAKRASDKWGLRMVVLALFLLQVTVLAVSHSKGAFLALGLYPVAWLLHVGYKYRMRLPKIAAVAYLLFCVAAGGWAWHLGLISDDGRMRLDANVPLTHWVIGNGLNSFEQRFPSVVTDLPITKPVLNTHLENEYLQTYWAAGALPTLILLFAAGCALFLAFLAGADGPAVFWLAPALAGETIHALVDFTGHVFPIVALYLVLWLLILTSLNGHSRAGWRQPRESGEP